MSGINKTFAYHRPSADGMQKITALREAFSTLSNVIVETCTTSREKSIALTELETAAMWAIKAVVFNDNESEVGG